MAAISPNTASDDWKRSMAGNARYSLPAGYDGSNGGGARKGGASGQLPHVDDLVSVPRDIDFNQSIKRLLELAEGSLRTAEIERDFNRPAQGLKDFIRASIIAVQVIRNHKDYPQLRDTRADLRAAHNNLLKKISNQNDSFAKIKEDIIADNKRTGVQPTVGGQQRGESPFRAGFSSPAGRETPPLTTRPAGGPTSQANGSPNKPKPPVQPKPQSLHGNALKPGHGRAASLGREQPDLLSRFANLRGPQPSPGQDSRIKTHQIVLPKPAGPREMPPPVAKPKLGLDSSISSLPKMPDAVYSPARGNIAGDAARQPMGTPRGMLSRTTSSTSNASTPNASQHPQMKDYFSSSQSHNGGPASARPSYESLDLPSGDVITAEGLYRAMKGKGSILVIDVRDREEFDEGHIMSSSTICIEPSILMREGLSADQISESLVISPAHEHGHFDKREQFDLVVYYDQDSEMVPRVASSSDDLALQSLHRALTQFNYGHELKNSVKILRGGLDAWIEFMGAASLQSTAMGSSQRSPQQTQVHRTGAIARRRRSKYVKKLKPDEVKAWQETLENEDMQGATSPAFIRTREEFLKRYPSVSDVSESMTSPVMAGQGPRYGSSHKGDLNSDLPSPPTRPAPALPRPSYSSLSHVANDTGFESPPVPPKTVGRTKTMEMAPPEIPRYYTGLNNPRNWCYSNGVLQSMLASPEFGRELAESGWTEKYKVPRKLNEKIEQPQLMTRILTNLFHWMSSGKFEVMKAQTLMDYSRHVCKHNPEQFGNHAQHDAQEFMTFLLDNLHEETNINRDTAGEPDQPNTRNKVLVQAAAEYWQSYRRLNSSLVDDHWRSLSLSTVQCQKCMNKSYTFAAYHIQPVTVNKGPPTTLENILRQACSPDEINEYECKACDDRTRAQQTICYARLPPLFCLALNRFGWDHRTNGHAKALTEVEWDFNDFDFSPFVLPQADRADAARLGLDRAFAAPFRYECYAVVIHHGGSADSGHYYAYVRDSRTQDPYAWLLCNDERIAKVRIGCGGREDVRKDVFRSGKESVPYLLFFRRKDVH